MTPLPIPSSLIHQYYFLLYFYFYPFYLLQDSTISFSRATLDQIPMHPYIFLQHPLTKNHSAQVSTSLISHFISHSKDKSTKKLFHSIFLHSCSIILSHSKHLFYIIFFPSLSLVCGFPGMCY